LDVFNLRRDISVSFDKVWNTLRWLPTYYWQRLSRHGARMRPLHLILAVADHFEPSIVPGRGQEHAPLDQQFRRLEKWCREYPEMVNPWRDCDGFPFRHTYFFPAEQYEKGLLDRLAQHCHDGWGEVEIQLHHGIARPDTPEQTRKVLAEFRETLVQHGCLSRINGGAVRYGFVHGNWALANSKRGQACGVDNEMQILAETGCYADFTLPSAPNPAQVSKINAIYECTLPLDRRAPHRKGRSVTCGRPIEKFPVIVQGPLLFCLSRPGKRRLSPYIENSALTTATPPSLRRLRLWTQANIHVRGRPDWVFLKLHCHGMDPRDEEGMLGQSARAFLQDLGEAQRQEGFRYYFTTAREMMNILLAACDGKEGSPGQYRNYRLRLIKDR
jgi:hypothetical protein